jgi:hypothetical protein
LTVKQPTKNSNVGKKAMREGQAGAACEGGEKAGDVFWGESLTAGGGGGATTATGGAGGGASATIPGVPGNAGAAQTGNVGGGGGGADTEGIGTTGGQGFVSNITGADYTYGKGGDGTNASLDLTSSIYDPSAYGEGGRGGGGTANRFGGRAGFSGVVIIRWAK